LDRERRPNANIGVTQSYTTIEDRYRYWLDGRDDRKNLTNFFVRDLIALFDECTLARSPDSDLIIASIPWTPSWSWAKEPLGVRKVFLDPALGFLPVKGEAEFHTSPKYWRIETFS